MAKKVCIDLEHRRNEARPITRGDIVVLKTRYEGFQFFMVVPVSENDLMLVNLNGQDSFIGMEIVDGDPNTNTIYREWVNRLKGRFRIERVIPHEEAVITVSIDEEGG